MISGYMPNRLDFKKTNKKVVLAQEEKNKLELLFYQRSLFTYYLYKLGQNSIKFLII